MDEREPYMGPRCPEWLIRSVEEAMRQHAKATEREPERCETCRFWDPVLSDEQRGSRKSRLDDGRCRRHAPALVPNSFGWPLTLREFWCGDYERKEPA